MTIGQRLAAQRTPCERRAFETAYTILEGSGLRYQSAQIEGLARILLAYAEHEIAGDRRRLNLHLSDAGSTRNSPPPGGLAETHGGD